MSQSNIQSNLSNTQINSTKKLFIKGMKKSKYLYILFIPVITWYILFCYVPMYGLIMAFEDYSPYLGILHSPWVGFKYFKQFFESIYIWRLIRNTLSISIYSLIAGFPIPIILALMINEVRNTIFKRSVQTILYLPNFLSTVVVVGMLVAFLSPSTGIINTFVKFFGGKPIHFLAEPSWFQTIYVWSGIWQGAGYGSIIYIAALAGIDPQLYEAATVDGASAWQRLWHITLPGLLPTIIILLILNMGSIFSVGYEKIILMYNPQTYETADVINTYVYREGILNARVSFSTAVGFFNSVINFIVIIIFNKFSKKVSEISLW